MWLGSIGHVTGLVYSFSCPGGCDHLGATLEVPVTYRNRALDPGRIVRVFRGGHVVWDGKLDEPVPTTSGWAITAEGAGNFGTDFVAQYTSTWPTSQPDQPINNAITRGMRWVNPGVGTPTGMWLGQAVDSADQTITALLNLVCTRGGLTWYVNSQPGTPGNVLSVFPLPTTVNRLLVSTTPVARTLGGDINTIFIKYLTALDNATTGAAATYAVTSVTNAASIAAHGPMEAYLDLSNTASAMTAGAAQTVGNFVLSIYVRASFSGPFTVAPGQLLTTGGQQIDPGCDQAGTVCQLVLTDYAYGGEVNPATPLTFIVGGYAWDDQAQVATITPYQSLDASLTGLLSMQSATLTPITATQ
jgi:hypothetical protein